MQPGDLLVACEPEACVGKLLCKVWIKSSKGGAHENSQAAPRCAKCAAQHLEFECLKDGTHSESTTVHYSI